MADLSKVLVKFGLGKIRAGSKHINLGKVTNRAEPWPALVERLKKVHRTPESFAEFLKLPKEGLGGQDALKAAAGFWIGCACVDESRRYTKLLPRTVLAFDMDTATPETVRRLDENDHALRDYVWVAHTTRKHTNEKPRLRFVVLLKEPVPTDQYEPLARVIASLLDPGLQWTDKVSFRATQLMYFPTASADGDFMFFEGPGAKLVDWKHLFERMKAKGRDLADVRNWPRCPDEDVARQRATKAEDPWEKPGIIGAFCRVYPIERLIEEHLSDFYEPGDANSTDVRYSWKHGGTSNGLVIYEDGRFATSHHTSDPLAGQSANAWDFARLVLYGDEDEGAIETKDVTSRASYKAMVAWARTLPDVQEEMLATQIAVDEAFDEEDEDATPDSTEHGDPEFFDETPAGRASDLEGLDDDDLALLGLPSSRTPKVADLQVAKPAKPPENWRDFLVKDEKLQIENNLPNVVTIMRFDPRWFGKVRFNELFERVVVTKPVKFKDKPWDNVRIADARNGDVIQDHHRATFRAVMESGQGSGAGKGGYGMSSVSQVNLSEGIELAARTDPFHPVKVFLGDRPKWDGKPRLSTMLSTHLDVEQTVFAAEAFTMMMVAAIARTFEPGHKFDHTLIIQGKQGAGKSTFLRMLGKIEWYREFDIGYDDPQKIAEKLSGVVILEQGEMAGFKKADMEDFKQFMSATETVVRMAYGREARVFKRRCVVFGTTNEEAPLRDPTGNRRIWFVRSRRPEEAGIEDMARLQADVDQCWHEAYHIYLRMRAAQPHGDLDLSLSRAARKIAAESNDLATKDTEFSIMAEAIAAWADTPVTKASLSPDRESAEPHPDDDMLVLRTRFNPEDAYTEALGLRRENFAREAWKVGAAVDLLREEWERWTKKEKFGPVRAKWVCRKGVSPDDRRRGWTPVPDDEDLIG